MSKTFNFKIDFKEEFDNLPNAPIVDAVIHWQAEPTKTPDPNSLFEDLETRLPDYPHFD